MIHLDQFVQLIKLLMNVFIIICVQLLTDKAGTQSTRSACSQHRELHCTACPSLQRTCLFVKLCIFPRNQGLPLRGNCAQTSNLKTQHFQALQLPCFELYKHVSSVDLIFKLKISTQYSANQFSRRLCAKFKLFFNEM